MITITINGNIERALIGSFGLTDNINARSTMSLTIDTVNPMSAGMSIDITDGVKIFGGTIDSFTKTYLKGTGVTRYGLTCIDYNQILDRRVIGETYENETLLTILTDIVANYLSSEGITLGAVALDTYVVRQAVFNYCTITDAFNFLRDMTNLNYNVDYNKELTFFLSGDNFGDLINDDNCYSMNLEETRQEYRNVQFVRAGDSTTAVQSDEIPSPKPDGQSKTFTLRFPIATKPAIKINTVAVDPADIGINGLDKNKKWYWQKNSRQMTQDDIETTLADTDTITISYQGLKPIIVRAENTTEIDLRKTQEGGTGYYENLISEKSIDDKTAAIQFANGTLKKYGDISQKVNIYTAEQRFAGELIRVQSLLLDIDEYYLITSVGVSLNDSGDARYSITAASGDDLGGWVEFFRSLKPSEQLEIRENEILVKIKVQSEPQGAQGVYNVKKFNALYPSNTLYPSETLYPNTTVIDTEVRND